MRGCYHSRAWRHFCVTVDVGVRFSPKATLLLQNMKQTWQAAAQASEADRQQAPQPRALQNPAEQAAPAH